MTHMTLRPVATCTVKGATYTLYYIDNSWVAYTSSDEPSVLHHATLCQDTTSPTAWWWHKTPDGRRVRVMLHDLKII